MWAVLIEHGITCTNAVSARWTAEGLVHLHPFIFKKSNMTMQFKTNKKSQFSTLSNYRGSNKELLKNKIIYTWYKRVKNWWWLCVIIRAPQPLSHNIIYSFWSLIYFIKLIFKTTSIYDIYSKNNVCILHNHITNHKR